MTKPSFLLTLTSAAIIATLSGCGGSGGVEAIDSPTTETVTDATDGTDSPTGNPSTAPQTINGRVADGYLQGAIVCVDLNENRACDDDEPSVVSGEGGIYELEMTAETEGKPIVADVPPTAIDEDTNEPIGRELVLSAPAERPDFISPITTLVHQELEDNPALDVDAAEATVKEELGLGDDEDTSLFTDYVEQSRDESADSAEQFQYLHQTAQIVARMMQEIQDTIEQTVTAEGVDLVGDKDARKALQRLLRDEVRSLLPEITRAVSDHLVAQQASEADGGAETEAFDPDAITTSLRPTSVDVDADRLQAEVDRRPAQRTTVEEILTDGFYWIDVDCGYHEEDRYDGETGTEPDEPNRDGDADVRPLDDEFDFTATEFCQAEYGHIVLSDSGDSVVETSFEYDADSASWTQIVHEGDDDEPPFALRLVDGEWIADSGGADGGSVEFTADGGAIITTDDGVMSVTAAVRDLADRPVLHHLWELGADTDATGIADSDLFPADSSAYIFNLTRNESQHVLFNWHDYTGDGNCDQFNGNCNAVQSVSDAGLNAVTSLDELLAVAAEGVTLAGLVHADGGQPVDAELRSVGNDRNGVGGVVKWRVNEYVHEQPDGSEPYPYEPEELVCVDSTGLPDPQQPLPDELDEIIKETLDPLPDHTEILQDESFDGTPPDTVACIDPELIDTVLADDAVSDSGEALDVRTTIARQAYGTSRWQVIEVQGVRMLELAIPVALRHRIDMDDAGAILLIEQDGYVRRGMRFSDSGTDSEVMYNDTAFGVMQDIAQGYAGQRQGR